MDKLINEIWERGLYDAIQDAYEEAGLDWGEVEQRYKSIIATEVELRGEVDENGEVYLDEDSIEKISDLIRKKVDNEARNNSKIDIYLPIFDD